MRQVRGLSGSQANPIPLTFAANETGSLAMVDPSQRSTMLTLLLEILDISDQLPLEVFVPHYPKLWIGLKNVVS